MELREYLKIFQKNISLILACAVLVGTAAFVYTFRQPVTYETAGNITVVPKSAGELKNVYEYDGYYALQAAASFTTTITSWLGSPDTVSEIYQKAGLDVGNQSAKALSKFVKTTPIANSFSLKYQLSTTEKEKTSKLAKAATDVVKEKTTSFNQKTSSKLNFEINSDEPIIIENKPPVTLYTIAGTLAGFVLGLFLALLREYFKKN